MAKRHDKTGWLWPHNHSKRHYFDEDGLSLCGWYTVSDVIADEQIGEYGDKYQCAACRKAAADLEQQP